jgi:hypothetical protein
MRAVIPGLTSLGVLSVLLLQPGTAQAAGPRLEGVIDGIEICTQDMCGGAIFLFRFDGKLNGRRATGWGWVEVRHETLPDVGEAGILGGEGELWIGFRRFCLEVPQFGGTLAGAWPDYEIGMQVNIRDLWGRTGVHGFVGLLSHQDFPPTIFGEIAQPSK